jgi:16S rRNA (uracil1498-N3)-methyltransferase
LVFDAREGVSMPATLPGEVWLAVGPEGGFDADELALLVELGYVRIRLDLPVMRVPTAAAVAVALARLAQTG